MTKIIELLETYHLTVVFEIAQACGINIFKNGKKLVKSELLQKLSQELFTRERVMASLAKLTPQEKDILNRLLLRNGFASTISFKKELIRAKLVIEPPVSEKKKELGGILFFANDYVASPRHHNSEVFEDVIARFTQQGLIFTGVGPNNSLSGKLQYTPAEIIFIPEFILPFFPPTVPLPEETVSSEQPPYILSRDPAIFLRDLYLYWTFVRSNEVPMVKSGFVAKRTLKTINNTLLMPDPLLDSAQREDELSYLYLLRLLLIALKLLNVQLDQVQLSSKDPLQIPPFWKMTLLQQITDCWKAWTIITSYKEVSDYEFLQYGANFITGRQAVAGALANLSSQHWFTASELLEQICDTNPNFLFPDHNGILKAYSSRNNYFYSRQSISYFSGNAEELFKKIEQLEQKFVKVCLNGFLYQLGLVDLGSDVPLQDSSVAPQGTVYRLTQPAVSIFHPNQKLASTPTVAQLGKVVIQPNFQVMAIGPVSLEILAQLDLCTDREQVDRGVFQYRISKPAAYRARQLKMSAAQIIKFLETVSQVELPQNVRRSLDEWGSHHDRIVFRQGVSVLQTANPALLNQILAEPIISKLEIRPLADHIALVDNKKCQKLLYVLLENQFLPAISDNNPRSVDNSVIINAEGLIQPVHVVPSLYLTGRLEQIADAVATGTWQITPQSVQRVGGSREKIDELLLELRTLNRGELSEKLQTAIKTWGGYYGTATIKTLTLVEFTSHESMTMLMNHPDLQSFFSPFPSGERPLAVIAAGQIEQVKTVFARLGVAIKSR